MRKSYLYIFILLSISLSCNKADTTLVTNLNNGKIWVIGHAGVGFQTGRNPIPSNSEYSVAKAIEAYNADGSEIDVQVSKDSILVLFHDDLMDQQTDCFGCINDKTYDEIYKCNYRQDFAVNAFQKVPVISFEYILQKYKDSKYTPLIFLDIKVFESCNQNTPQYLQVFARELVKLIIKYDLSQRVFVQSDNGLFIKNIRLYDTERKIKILRSAGASYEESKSFALENDLDGIEIFNKSITKENVDDAHANNLLVIIFDTKDRKSIVDAVNKHPDGIETDNIPLLQSTLSKH